MVVVFSRVAYLEINQLGLVPQLQVQRVSLVRPIKLEVSSRRQLELVEQHSTLVEIKTLDLVSWQGFDIQTHQYIWSMHWWTFFISWQKSFNGSLKMILFRQLANLTKYRR